MARTILAHFSTPSSVLWGLAHSWHPYILNGGEGEVEKPNVKFIILRSNVQYAVRISYKNLFSEV